jgi:hypothetical protein
MTKEQLEHIKKPLPKEAVTQHPTKQNLSTIKAIYVTERLNEVFGVGSWTIKTELVGPGIIEKTRVTSSGRERVEFTAVLKTVLEIPDHKIYYESIASSVNDDPGDACKGATTDAITKICSYIGIGIDVFKGKHDSALQQYESDYIQGYIQQVNTLDSKDKITDYAKSLGDDIKANPSFRKAVSDKLKSL